MHEADVLDESGRERIAVVIPTLNESAYIERCLSSIESQESPFEIIVCDGRSTDGTPDLVRGRAKLLQTRPGRARQLNEGTRASNSPIVVFLHADTTLPDGGLALIRETLRDPQTVGGCFRLLFDERNLLLAFYSWGTTMLKWDRLVFGDRAIFARRSTFDSVGGFPEQPLFEDMEFFCAINNLGKLKYLRAGVITASRRFAKSGYFRQQAKNLALWILYQLGVSSHGLIRFYPTADEHSPRDCL